MKRYLETLLCAAVLCLPCLAAPEQEELPAFLDRSKPAEERAADIVRRLTVDEKVMLMMFESPEVERLGIPAYNWWNEALHGVARNGNATVYPMPIGMAASFDDQLLREVFSSVSDEAVIKYRIARQEGRGAGWYEGLSFWTPNINIFRDPRWGRGMETYGEDPYLTSVMGGAVVDGLQGAVTDSTIKTLACAKHFAVHSGPESSRHSFDTDVSDRDLYETYLPAFKHLVTVNKVGQVMFAYNRFQGVPCGASERLLREILVDSWGYKGIILSDCGAVDDFFEEGCHGYSEDAASAASASVKAGADLECGTAFRHLTEALERGLVTEDVLDKSLIKLFSARIRMGDLDEGTRQQDIPDSLLCGREHAAQALRMAHETMTLLMNKNGVLPLAKDAKVALVGPNADACEMLWGNYNGFPVDTVTFLDAMRESCPALVYHQGCGLVMDLNADPESGQDDLYRVSSKAVDDVLEAVRDCDVVVFAGGISPSLEGEELNVEIPGFAGGDRTSIELPQVQRELIKAIHDAGKKVVLVNFSGSAIGLVPETENCDAILQAWYPGQEGGKAVTDVLYGRYNPSGKLPLTFYKSVDQLPDFENYDMAGHTYRYFRGEPLFRFGYGQSYTTFRFGKLRLRRHKAVIKIRNTGTVDGEEVVQLYVRNPLDTDGPSLTLRGFKRVSVPAGKTVKVEFPLSWRTFEWWSRENNRMESVSGKYEILVGNSSDLRDLKVRRYRFI